MSWRKFHDISIEFSSLAEGLERGQDIKAELKAFLDEQPELADRLSPSLNSTELMLQLYRLAAEAEEEALRLLEPTKLKTRGISAVRAASLWLKAREFRQTQRACDYWIEKAELGEFPDFGVADLEELLNIIQLRFDLRPEDLFCPGEPIKRRKKHLFVGRFSEMKEALDWIKSGFSLVITGEKGVGKTSFAWQLMELLTGEPETCDHWQWSPNQPYRCVWLSCSTEIQSIENILSKLLQSSCCDFTLSRYFPEVISSIEIPSTHFKASIYQAFMETLEKIRIEHSKRKLIIFLDSLHLVQDLKFFRDLLFSTHELVQFIVIGQHGEMTRHNVSPPAIRLIEEIRINRLTSQCLDDFFTKIEERHFFTILFEQEFRNQISQMSYCIPELIHRLSFNALKQALTEYEDISIPLYVKLEHLSQDEDFPQSRPETLQPSKNNKRNDSKILQFPLRYS